MKSFSFLVRSVCPGKHEEENIKINHVQIDNFVCCFATARKGKENF